MHVEIINKKLKVKEIDIISTKINNKWVKVKNKIFLKVSRIFAISIEDKLELTLDVNTEIYPIHDEDMIEFKLFHVNIPLEILKSEKKGWEEYLDKEMIDAFEYVMFGTIFHCGIEEEKFFIYGSFGGLLMKIFGNLSSLFNKNFSVDSKILLLIRKL